MQNKIIHQENGLALRRRSPISIWQSLGLRALLVLALLGIAMAGHWVDRDGLRDNVDGSVSFLDVVYFTTVTVTTVGYGDIVPVTEKARLFDTLVVTPIRLFIWMIFLGTAYTFVLKNTWEKMRTRMIQKTLNEHIVICGYGSGGEASVEELLRQKEKPTSIVIIDPDPDRVALAIERGLNGLRGDASHNSTLVTACIHRARAVIIAPGRDDTAALIVLSSRQMNPKVRISVNVRAVENEDLLRQAGADSVINSVSFGGHLLARSAISQKAVDYLQDLTSAYGRVMINERPAAADDFGKPLKAITTGLGVRLHRNEKIFGYWETEKTMIEPGDIIIEIVRVNENNQPISGIAN